MLFLYVLELDDLKVRVPLRPGSEIAKHVVHSGASLGIGEGVESRGVSNRMIDLPHSWGFVTVHPVLGPPTTYVYNELLYRSVVRGIAPAAGPKFVPVNVMVSAPRVPSNLGLTSSIAGVSYASVELCTTESWPPAEMAQMSVCPTPSTESHSTVLCAVVTLHLAAV